MTRDTYAHVMETTFREAAASMDGVLGDRADGESEDGDGDDGPAAAGVPVRG